MSETRKDTQIYICPMHSDVRQPDPGKCPTCGMALIPEGAKFGLLRHMISNPVHLVLMLALMATLMAAVMMMRAPA